MLLCREPERGEDRLPQAARRVTEGHQMPTRRWLTLLGITTLGSGVWR
jgi:hypothetical protein